MSLQSTIHKLNNDLISLFAIMDTWLDRNESDFDGNTTNSFHIRKKTIVDFLIVNKQVLDFVNRISDEDDALDICFEVEAAYENVSTIIENEIFAQRFLDAGPDHLRETLREQLFQLLCLIDALHDKRLDVMSAMLHPQYAAGLDTIKSLIKAVGIKLSKYQEPLWN